MDMNQPRYKVLINGAGIAGNSLAFWLAKVGHDVTVVERFPQLRVSGLQLDLRNHGVQVLRHMGLEQRFRAKSVPEEGLQIVDSKGKRRAYFPVGDSDSTDKPRSSHDLTTQFEIMRGDLCRILYDAASTCGKTPAKFVFNTSVESFEEKDDSVHVRFQDGKTDRYDLLVGADGQWSQTRRIMFGSDNTGSPVGLYPIHDVYFAYFTMRRQMEKGEEYVATSFMAPGKRGILTRRHTPHEVLAMISCKTDSERLRGARRGDVKEEKEALADVFHGAGWRTDDIIKGMKEADDFYCERLGLVKLRNWSRGRVVLIGDAAHCPTVLTGMGTTCAMVGSYILAGEIDKHCRRVASVGKPEDLKAALAAYEKRFRPFTDEIQKGVAERAQFQWALLASPISISVINWAMGLASYLNISSAGGFGVQDTARGWSLPEYPGMIQKEGI